MFNFVSVATTFKARLAKSGVIFCSISEALQCTPNSCAKYLGTVGSGDGQFLRDAELGGLLGRVVRLRARGRALPDGTVDVTSGINERNTGQFERTLIIADKGSSRQLSRRLHRAHARRKPVARRRRRADRAR